MKSFTFRNITILKAQYWFLFMLGWGIPHGSSWTSLYERESMLHSRLLSLPLWPNVYGHRIIYLSF